MNLRKSLSWLLVLVLILLTAAIGCNKAPGTELTAIELVPQQVNLLANIQVTRIINDPDFQDAYDAATKEPGQPQTFEEALNELVKETGLDLRQFSEATVFADITTMEQADYVGCVAEGTFDEKEFIDNIESNTGEQFNTSDYKGYKLYTDEDQELSLAFLSDSMLLLGTIRAVKDAIDVSKGVRKPVGGAILDTYNQLGDALIKFAFEFPEEARRALAEGVAPGEIPVSLEPFADIDIIGFLLNKEADTITIRITPHFLSTDSANDARDTLGGAITMFKGMLQDPEMKELLGKIQVTADGSWLAIAFEITLSEIERLSETFQPQ